MGLIKRHWMTQGKVSSRGLTVQTWDQLTEKRLDEDSLQLAPSSELDWNGMSRYRQNLADLST